MAKKKKSNLLLTYIFTPEKDNGVREGFRRLSIILGVAYFAYYYDLISQGAAAFVNRFDLSFITGTFLDILNVIAGILVFFVVVLVVRAIGWVFEGFFKTKK